MLHERLATGPDPEIERLAVKVARLDRKKLRHCYDDLESKRRAITAFDSHQIRERGERHFTIMRPREDGSWDSNMGAEILVGLWGTIYVGGDIGPVVYAYGPKGIRERIAWMGGTDDVGYYVAQKASIGTRSGNGMVRWDEDDMILDLKNYVEDYEDCHGHEIPEALKEAIEDYIRYPTGSRDLAANHFYERLGYDDIEEILDMGQSVDANVYYTWAALRRLHLLLGEEAGTLGR